MKAINTRKNKSLSSFQNTEKKIEKSTCGSDDFDRLSAVIVIDDDYSEASVVKDDFNQYSGIYEPKPKKIKIVTNTEDMSKKLNENYIKASNQSNIPVISSKNKHEKVGSQLENLKKEQFPKKYLAIR